VSSGSGPIRKRGKRSRDGIGRSGDAETHVQCRICHRWYQAITYTHLRYKHGVEPDAYKEEFALSKITSQEVRRRIAEQKFLVDRHATDYIRKHWGKVPLRDITRYLGINSSTARAHALRLGLGLLVEKWSDAKVLRMLREARKLGRPLSSGEARHGMGRLYKAAIKHFGSWKHALTQAGIAYEEVSRRGPFETWTRERILDEIQMLRRRGKDRDYLFLRTHHSKLYAAARNHFGNWARALGAAGPSEPSK